MEHAVESTKHGKHKGASQGRASNAGVGERSLHPMLRLQQQIGNQAVGELMRSGSAGSFSSANQAALAVTENGRTTFHPQAFSHPRFLEIAAHEAVHRAQFRAFDKPLGTRSELERDAVDGSRSMLSAGGHTPTVRAPSGQALYYPVDTSVTDHEAAQTAEDNTKSLERLGPGASQTGKVVAEVSSAGTADRKHTTSFHLEASGQGSHGSIASTTELVFDYDPGDPFAPGVSAGEIGPAQKGDPVALYPITLAYSRYLMLTDAGGRKCVVEIVGRVRFTHETFAKASQSNFGRMTFDSLMHMRGDEAELAVSLHGTGLVQNYNSAFSIDGDKTELLSLSSVAAGAAAFLPLPGDALNLFPQGAGQFILPMLPAGEQFDSLEAYLESADKETMSRRVMADLERLTRGTVPKQTESSDESENHSGTLGGLLGTIFKGVFAGLLIVGAVFAVAALPGVSLGLAIGVVMGTLTATALLNALIQRSQQAVNLGIRNPLSIFSAAVLDTIGYSELYKAVTDKDVFTGQEFHQSLGSRVDSGVVGVIQLFMSAMGAKGLAEAYPSAIEEPPAPDTAASAGTPVGGVDSSQFSTPEEYLNALRSSPKSYAGPSWDHARFPRGPNVEWRPGDPIDMPETDGTYPKWDDARPRFWRNRAALELEGRATGSRAQDPNSTDPISSMSDQDLATLRDTPSSRVRAPREVGTGRAMEVEHFGVQQQVRGWLEDAGFSESDAGRITGAADPNSLMSVSRVEHAFFDAGAHGFGRFRADPNGAMWADTPWADERVADPLIYMEDARIVEIVNAARANPLINLANSPDLLAALRAEIAKRGLSIQPP